MPEAQAGAADQQPAQLEEGVNGGFSEHPETLINGTAPAPGAEKENTLAEAADVVPLPPPPASIAGETRVSKDNYEVSVSNKAGYMCHILLKAKFAAPPAIVFSLFTHPDNSGVFRDIKDVPQRKVLEENPGWKVVEVEQIGELRILWMRRIFSTFLHVEEDSREPSLLTTTFTLLRSDVLTRFGGKWELRPLLDAEGNVVGTDAQLEQDVLPKGVPAFMSRLPLLGGLLRNISVVAITRILEDMHYILKKWTPESDLGELLKSIAAERGYKPSAPAPRVPVPDVQSFAVDGLSDEEQEELEVAPLAVSISEQPEGHVALGLTLVQA